jgi:Xaa-Pro aminopeptidase
MSQPLGRLLYADSERCADMLYATGLFVPDPFLWCAIGERRLVVVSPLEYGRFLRHLGATAEVHSFTTARQAFRCRNHRPATLIAALGRACGVKRWQVPADFPLGLALELRRRGVTCQPVTGMFFPEREHKQAAEIAHLRAGVQLAEAGLAVGLDILRAARIKGDAVVWRGQPLTAELLRGEIDAAITRQGGIAAHTIVAPGPEGADPHNAGSGPIRPHQPIIIDIFPRVTATGYFGDLTRTVVKGRAPAVVQRAFTAVRAARDGAKAMIRAGVQGQQVHKEVKRVLEQHGFATDLNAKPPYGFFHGTGHGLGLEVHEPPRINTSDQLLAPGHVVTVEPGVYYPEWGGVRLEDVVVVTERGCETLTTAETYLEIA